jgi:hypothetical protein
MTPEQIADAQTRLVRQGAKRKATDSSATGSAVVGNNFGKTPDYCCIAYFCVVHFNANRDSWIHATDA